MKWGFFNDKTKTKPQKFKIDFSCFGHIYTNRINRILIQVLHYTIQLMLVILAFMDLIISLYIFQNGVGLILKQLSQAIQLPIFLSFHPIQLFW